MISTVVAAFWRNSASAGSCEASFLNLAVESNLSCAIVGPEFAFSVHVTVNESAPAVFFGPGAAALVRLRLVRMGLSNSYLVFRLAWI